MEMTYNEMITYNGIIRDFDLVISEFEIFTFNLLIECEYGFVNFGNWKFSDGKLEAFVHDLMNLLGVTEAYKIHNSTIRFGYDEMGNPRIGHLFRDEWLDYKDYMKG